MKNFSVYIYLVGPSKKVEEREPDIISIFFKGLKKLYMHFFSFVFGWNYINSVNERALSQTNKGSWWLIYL